MPNSKNGNEYGLTLPDGHTSSQSGSNNKRPDAVETIYSLRCLPDAVDLPGEPFTMIGSRNVRIEIPGYDPQSPQEFLERLVAEGKLRKTPGEKHVGFNTIPSYAPPVDAHTTVYGARDKVLAVNYRLVQPPHQGRRLVTGVGGRGVRGVPYDDPGYSDDGTIIDRRWLDDMGANITTQRQIGNIRFPRRPFKP